MRCRTGVHDMLFDRFGEVGWGGNGGFHAINIAIQFGATRIVLVGFDMSIQKGLHWFGKHHGMNNPTQAGVDKWRARLDAQAPALRKMGIDVVIGSPHSALTAYPKADIVSAIKGAI